MEKKKKKIITIVALGVALLAITGIILGIVFGTYKPNFDYVAINPGTLKQPEVPRTDPTFRDKYPTLKKYADPVDITVGCIQYGLEDSVKPGTTPINQTFNKIAKDYLNINLNYTVVAASTVYDSKINLALASGKLPDMFYTTTGTLFSSLRDSGMLADLSDAFWHLNDNLLDNYLVDLPDVLPTVMKDSGIYSFPALSNTYATAQRFYLREDWLDIIKMSSRDIKTVNDLIRVGEKFVENKEEIAKTLVNNNLSLNDAIKRVIPFTMQKEITWAGSYSAEGIFNAHGASLSAYFDDGNDNLIASISSPETKNALTTLSTMYKKGILDKEFLSKSTEDIQANIKAGYVGMVSGEWWLPKDALDSCISNIDGAKWTWVDLPSAEGIEAAPVVDRISVSGYNLVSKSCKNPEAIAKLINLFYDIYYSDDAGTRYVDSKTGNDLTDPSNGFYYQFVPVKVWDGVASINEYKRVQGAFEQLYDAGFYGEHSLSEKRFGNNGLYQEVTELQDEDVLISTVTDRNGTKYYVLDRDIIRKINNNSEWKNIFNKLKTREKKLHFADGYPYYVAYKQGIALKNMNSKERNGWGIYHEMVDKNGSYAYVVDLTEGTKKAKYNEFYGSSLSSMTTYGEYITSQANKIFTQIITGDRPVSDFDSEFVSKVYNNNGGQTILQQVNSWYDAQPKKPKK